MNKRTADILTALLAGLAALASQPYEIEKLPIPPAAKGWISLLGILGAVAMHSLRNQLPAANPPSPTPPTP